ncbi:MAG: efflux RND transporter periplasmic adaptor subunit [Alphaproteobacteria bacterium]|nr:efflux RND transporter periplasmic adaptor subunit [Alphaproteobacteria bacterium]
MTIEIKLVRRTRRVRTIALVAAAILVATSVAGCNKKIARTPEARPVRAVTVETAADGETVSFTGQIRAKDEVNLGFRIDGRLIERTVDVGDVVKAGEVVARLDPKDEHNALASARANLASLQAALTQARLTFQRQQELLKNGWTPRAKYDESQQLLQTAEGQVQAAQAQVRLAEDRLSYTILRADGPGAVIAKGAEPGEVVQAGHMVVQLARQGGRDAIFDIPEQLIRTGPRDPVVQLALSDDPQVKALGRVREVAPQADSATRTFQVKVAIIDPPASMHLGATVTGRIKLPAPEGMEVPASALLQGAGGPAVWVVDRQNETVSLRQIEVARYDPTGIVVSRGLEKGDVVVTAGVQMLRPGQKVRLLGDG